MCQPNIESQNRISTRIKYTEEDDGLTHDWWNYSTFVNPPYSQIDTWIDKCIFEYENRIKHHKEKSKPIVLLVPARSDTKWFHTIAEKPYTQVMFIRGRLKFNNTASNAPFPSCLICLSLSSHVEMLTLNCTLLPSWTLDLKKL